MPTIPQEHADDAARTPTPADAHGQRRTRSRCLPRRCSWTSTGCTRAWATPRCACSTAPRTCRRSRSARRGSRAGGPTGNARIPGADHVCMVDDLSDPAGRYPYTLPPDARLEALLSRLGIGHEHRVVLYGAAHPMVVTRAWWVLSALGHARVSILDGGWEGWTREGRPVTNEHARRSPARFTAARRADWIADADDVARAIAGGAACVLNALSREQFDGRGGAHYGRQGRIPSSVSVPARDLVDYATMRWAPPDRLAARFAAAGITDRSQPVITYCGGGIAASVPFFALRMLGFERVALYDNSLLEWAADPARPMER
ncbi:MAG: rhodanese-like domain-containing protein [Burkholderiaceae bacterium]